MESNMPLTRCVQVRSPSLNQTLSFPFDHATTVDSLKQSIQTQHPYHPSPGDQRIIYRGKILLDTEILSNILEKCDNSTLPTFHLVVKPSLSDTIPTTTPTPTAPINTTADTDTMARPVPPSYSAHNTFIPATATETPIINSQLSGFPSLVPGGYQVIAINGQFYLAPVLVPSYPTTTTPAIATAAAAATAATTNLAPPPPDQARMAERPRVLTRRATLWLALKLAFALFITCHGASIERILFLHFLALVFFMYRTGRFRVVIRRVTLGELQGRFQPAQQQRDNPIQQQQQVNAPTQQNNGNTDRHDTPPPPPSPSPPTHSSQESNSGPDQVAEQLPTTRLSVIKRGAFTFVASLWPNYGHDPRLAQAIQNEQQEDMEQL